MATGRFPALAFRDGILYGGGGMNRWTQLIHWNTSSDCIETFNELTDPAIQRGRRASTRSPSIVTINCTWEKTTITSGRVICGVCNLSDRSDGTPTGHSSAHPRHECLPWSRMSPIFGEVTAEFGAVDFLPSALENDTPCRTSLTEAVLTTPVGASVRIETAHAVAETDAGSGDGDAGTNRRAVRNRHGHQVTLRVRGRNVNCSGAGGILGPMV
jgi:hypothetical protein